MTGEPDRLVPRTHSHPQAEPAPQVGLMDMENDVRGSCEMADAVFALLEREAVNRPDDPGLKALVRCAVVLQGFTHSVLETWEEAINAKRAA